MASSTVLCRAGNLLVMPDGRVGFIDFGIVGRVSPVTWGAVEALLLSTQATPLTPHLIIHGAHAGSAAVLVAAEQASQLNTPILANADARLRHDGARARDRGRHQHRCGHPGAREEPGGSCLTGRAQVGVRDHPVSAFSPAQGCSCVSSCAAGVSAWMWHGCICSTVAVAFPRAMLCCCIITPAGVCARPGAALQRPGGHRPAGHCGRQPRGAGGGAAGARAGRPRRQPDEPAAAAGAPRNLFICACGSRGGLALASAQSGTLMPLQVCALWCTVASGYLPPASVAASNGTGFRSLLVTMGITR